MRSTVFLVLVLLCLGAIPAFAQDLGPAADTVALVITKSPSANAGQDTLELELWVYNDDLVKNANVGFEWFHPDLEMVGSSTTALVQNSFDLAIATYENSNIATTNANDRFLFAGARLFNGVTAGTERRLWATWTLVANTWSVTDSIVIDTLTFSNGSIYVFVNANTLGYKPVWTAGDAPIVIYDPDRPAASNMIVSPTEINVTAQEGSGVQPIETFNVSSDGDPLTLNISESVSWLSVNPASGTTPQDFDVTVDVTGLAPGPYSGDITINSPDADNAPQTVTVNLTVQALPPEIAVDPTSLTFSGTAGGANPASQALEITNVGGSSLDPTLSTGTPWLSVTPTAGTAPLTVSVSVDITGLGAGSYSDTVTISDPDATNNPVKVPVTLTLTSNNAPVFGNGGVRDTSATECDTLLISFFASDADGDDVDFWVEPLAPNMTLTNMAGNMAQLRFEPTFDQAGTYVQTVYASDGIDTISGEFTITIEDCDPGYDAVAQVSPDPIYVVLNSAIDPIVGTVLLGNITDGVHTVEDIDQSSILLDGAFSPISVSVLDAAPGFTGKVLEMSYYVRDFIDPKIPVFDTNSVNFTVEGSYTDATPFTTADQILFVGKLGGDMNGNGELEVTDVTYMVDYLFLGGAAPVDPRTDDFDFSGDVGPLDLTRMVDYFFR